MTTTNETTAPLLVLHECGDWYFTGDLRSGKRLALRDRTSETRMEETESGPVYRVELSADGRGADEWGASTEDMAEAWRFALGAYFGPLDEEYDGSELAAMLRVVSAHPFTSW